MCSVIVRKLNHQGQETFRYSGVVLARGETWVQLEARLNLPGGRTEMRVGSLMLLQGDRFIEHFYSDRWYNIFEIHAAADNQLKGWYCNITRPAAFEGNAVQADDLALDLLVLPDGRIEVLDEEEFAVLPLSEAERGQALAALETLRRAVQDRTPPFAAVP